MRRVRRVMLAARETFFLRSGDDAAILDEARRRIVENCVDAEGVHVFRLSMRRQRDDPRHPRRKA